MLKNVTLQETADRLEVRAPWLGRGRRVALSFAFLLPTSLWLWSESERMVQHPATVLVPLPLFLCLGYGIAAVVIGSTRILIGRDGAERRYEGLPTLPASRVSRNRIVGVCYWDQLMRTRYGSYLAGMAAIECEDGTHVPLFDSLESKADAQQVSERIAAWWNAHPLHTSNHPIAVREGSGYPVKADMAATWRILGAGVGLCVLLMATAIASEFLGI